MALMHWSKEFTKNSLQKRMKESISENEFWTLTSSNKKQISNFK